MRSKNGVHALGHLMAMCALACAVGLGATVPTAFGDTGNADTEVTIVQEPSNPSDDGNAVTIVGVGTSKGSGVLDQTGSNSVTPLILFCGAAASSAAALILNKHNE